MTLSQTLKQLETALAELKTDGITLNQREQKQVASALKKDVDRDVPPAKRKGFFAQMLDIGKQALPLLLPIIKMIV